MLSGSLKTYKKILADKRVHVRYARLRVVAGPTRYKILVLLGAKPSGMTVSDLAGILSASLSRVSHQMRILRKYGMVASVRRGRTITYSRADRAFGKYLGA
jgi:DNA-binding transcriptional ArsR family regulator